GVSGHEHAHLVTKRLQHGWQRAAHIAEPPGLHPRCAFGCREKNFHAALPCSTANGKPCALAKTARSPSDASPVRWTSCDSPVSQLRQRVIRESASAPRLSFVSRHSAGD